MGKKKRAKKAEAQAARLKAALATAQAELEKTRARLEKAKDKAARWKQEAKENRDSSADSAAPEEASTPDETWTVAELRAEARARGISGMSNKTKAELLAALS